MDTLHDILRSMSPRGDATWLGGHVTTTRDFELGGGVKCSMRPPARRVRGGVEGAASWGTRLKESLVCLSFRDFAAVFSRFFFFGLGLTGFAFALAFDLFVGLRPCPVRYPMVVKSAHAQTWINSRC